MTSVTDGNGNVMHYSYDDFGRVVKVTNALGNSAYTTYDESGNVLTSTDYAGNVTTYTYDNFDRVSSKTNNDGTVSYTYTTDGKLSSVTDNSGVTVFTYDNMDGLTRVDYPDGSYVAYDYDNACRLTSVTTPFGTTSYEYDMLDRLTRVVDRNGYATIYEYDANGNRTAVRYANGYTTTYDYDLLNRLVRQETLDNNGEVVVQYIYTLGADLISQERDGRTYTYLYDGHGSVVGLMSESGSVTDTYTYDAFGNLLKSTGRTQNNYRYCGEQFDSTTGLYYLRARYMDTSTGRFISQDSYAGSIYDPVSLHKYLYANSNPVMYSDPSGYFSLSEFGAVQSIESTLHSILVPNFSNLIKWINFFASYIDTCNQLGKMLSNGATLADVAKTLARGFISGALLNYMCTFKAIGPILSHILIGYGFYVQFEAFDQAVSEGDTFTAVLISIQVITDGIALFDSCFTGDTLVAVEDGQKRIDEINVGDKVWAYNSETGETELKEVLQVYIKGTDELLHLETSDGEIIDTTTNHPFYVEDKGWVAAGDLEIGDFLYTVDGNTVEVTDIEVEKLDEPIFVYNLDVADFDTYFVGEFGVLVHNYEKPRAKMSDDGIVDVEIPRDKYPEYANHVENAINNGQPEILTIDRGNSGINRADAIGGYNKVPGMDLDEYPPAMFAEGGFGADVVPMNRHDNRGAGSTIGALLSDYDNGQQVRIKFT